MRRVWNQDLGRNGPDTYKQGSGKKQSRTSGFSRDDQNNRR